MRNVLLAYSNDKPFHYSENQEPLPLNPAPGGCTAFLRDWEHKNLVLTGGSGSGKTLHSLWKLIQAHIVNAIDANGLTFCDSLYCAPDWKTCYDVGVPTLVRLLDHFGLKYDVRRSGARSFVKLLDFSIDAERESIIHLRSAENPNGLFGITVAYAVADEVALWKEDDDNPRNDPVTQLPQRVRDSRARIRQIVWCSTPQGCSNRFYKLATRKGDDTATYVAHTADNPDHVISGEYVERLQTLLPPHLHDQYLRGVFLDLQGGLAFTSFSQSRNVDKTLTLDRSLPLHVSWDFGSRSGCHIILGQFHPEDEKNKWCKTGLFTALYEINKPSLDVRKACIELDRIVKVVGGWNFPEVHIFGDASGATKNTEASETAYRIIRNFFAEWKVNHRNRVPLKNPLVLDRVNTINWHLQDIQGKVRYKIHPRCSKLITDLEECRLDEKGTSLDKSDKLRTHAIDADSYRLHYISPIAIPKPNQSYLGRISA